MPIEIKELHIKAIVSDNSHKTTSASIRPEDIIKIKKELAKEVTEKVLRILQQKTER